MRERPVVEVLDATLADLVREGNSSGHAWAQELQARQEASLRPSTTLQTLTDGILILWRSLLFGTRRVRQHTSPPIETSSASKEENQPVSLDWALATGVAAVLAPLGKHFSESEKLTFLTRLYAKALTDGTRERDPPTWLKIQIVLGSQLIDVGQRCNDLGLLEKAIGVLRRTTEEVSDSDLTHAIPAQFLLGRSLLLLGERKDSANLIHQSVDAFQRTLKNVSHGRKPGLWALVQSELGIALGSLGKREDNRELLVQGIEALRQSIAKISGLDPVGWAITESRLADSLLYLGEKEGSLPRMREAIVAYRRALVLSKRLFAGEEIVLMLRHRLELAKAAYRTHRADHP